ncbi:MAG: helix-turn-helix transcriptional regulator [Bacteroidaceae bacterium]|nr:helix-turn-helix transcriptional regulator [Bacteroidaceae bacterium]
MSKPKFEPELFPRCPIRNILTRICDRWSLLVLYTLETRGTMRFTTLRHDLPDISQKMLAQTLRHLEQDGFITRHVYAEVPPRVEYSLTGRAHSIMPIIDNLIEWAVQNMPDIMRDRSVDKEKGI